VLQTSFLVGSLIDWCVAASLLVLSLSKEAFRRDHVVSSDGG